MRAKDWLSSWPVIRSLANTRWTLGPHSCEEWAPSCVSQNLWPALPGCTGTMWKGKSLGRQPSGWPRRRFEWNNSLEFQLPGWGYCDSLSISGRGREREQRQNRPLLGTPKPNLMYHVLCHGKTAQPRHNVKRFSLWSRVIQMLTLHWPAPAWRLSAWSRWMLPPGGKSASETGWLQAHLWGVDWGPLPPMVATLWGPGGPNH